MFTQSADHDNENPREEGEEEDDDDDRQLLTQPQPQPPSIFQKQHRQEQEQEYPFTNTEQLQPPPKESQIISAATTSSCYGYETLASSSDNYSNHFKTTTATSSNISLPWPPPPPLAPSTEKQQPQPISDDTSSNSGHKEGRPLLSRSSPNSIENTHHVQPNFLNTNITIPRRLDSKNNLSEECSSQQQQLQQLAGPSGSRQLNIEQIAQQRYQNHRQQQQNFNQLQSSQLLKWQGNSDVTTPINQSIVDTNYTIRGPGAGASAIATPISASGANITNVNYHLPQSQQGPLFSNQDNNNSNCTLAGAATKPFQEELTTTLHSAIRAMSWNHSLRHDQLYRVRHNNSSPYASGNGGQDYYRQLYQQRRFHHHHQQQQQQGGFEAGFMQQDSHATKMIKLDSSSVDIARQHHQYPYYGSTFGAGGHQSSGARDIQQLRYQLQPIRSNTSSICATNNSSGSNSSSSGKELKENYTDLESSNYHDGKSKEFKDNQQQQQQQQQQHLVRTISDLPVFVTIEDFRVASYTIAGEPHLCLPQLLQFLRQHFDTKTMVEKFEESLIHFPSANPKQVEGFIKSSCLPPSAKSCPLIKRSDADKICLSLFEELSKTNVIKHPSDIVGVRTKQQPQQQIQEKYSEKNRDKTNDTSIDEKRSNYSPTRNTESSEKPFVKEPTDSIISIDNIYVDNVTMDNSTNPLQSQSPRDVLQQEKNVIVASYSDDKYATVTKKLKCNNDESDSTRSDSSSTQDASEHSPSDGDRNEQIELSHDKISPTTSLCSSSGGGDGDDVKVKKKEQAQSIEPSSGTTSGNVTHDTLFESEAQSSILNFARAITSTLMIRVYHKCFGKCIGSFYPSLLKSKRFECIQCTTCKIMLTPRRFVGHTHGSKENDVCHWGFNSYNWRAYIRLSKKQPMNSLDEDELLRQFSALSSTSYDRNTDRQPSTSTSILTVSPERKNNLIQPCCASTSTARVDPNYQQNPEQSKHLDSSMRLARTDRQIVSSGQATTSSEGSTPQPSTSNPSSMGQNISISTLRGYNNLDESSSLHLLTPSTSGSSQSGGPKQLVSNSQYINQHTSNLDDRGFTRLARSASLSGRIPYSACCSGSLAIPTPTVLTSQQSTEQYGLANTMNPYPVIPLTNTVTPNLFSSQSDQLTGDLRNFLLQNWSTPSTVPHPHPHLQPPPPSQTSATTTQLPMPPLGPLGLPITAGQTCNSLPPTEVPRPSRSSNNLDFTKHLSLSAESRRELHVCTNLSTYLSRRGLSAGMTGDIVEKVLNLMRESRSTL